MYYFAVSIFLLNFAVQVVPEQCITPDQHEGDCVCLYACPALAAAIVTQKREAFDFVRRSNCGGTAVEPYVCCRRSSRNEPPEKCTTPDSKEGECISLYSCPSLTDALGTRESEAIELVRRSNCGGTAVDPRVCCSLSPKSEGISNTTKNNTTSLLTENSTTIAAEMKLVSDRKYCGYQHSDDYFRSQNATSLDEYPWLAFLIYVDKEGKRNEIWVCSGALINNRYVLSQDICTSKRYDLTLIGIRLGDHDVDAKTDCVSNSPLGECSPPYEEYGIESITDYSGPNKINGHNLVLIRLNQTIDYSDYIRPICLPEPSTAVKVGDTLITSGWSRSIFRSQIAGLVALVNTKKSKTSTTITSNEKCSRDFPRLKFTENHLCTTDVEGSENWNWIGNFGGPLMSSVRNQWQVDGVVDRGDAFTQQHIKVANYVEWIEENVKP